MICLWQLTPDRVAEWRDIRLYALAHAPEAFESLHAVWKDRPLEDFADRLRMGEIWAAGDDMGRPLAVAALEPDRTEVDQGWVMSVFVRPEARGRGLGLRLLDHLALRGRALGMTRLALHVGRDDLPARALYRRAGFVETRAPVFQKALGLWDIEMRRML